MVEVGTTNRTRLSDYEHALGPSTGLLAKIHRSNFGLVGFTEEASVAELSRLAQRHQVPLFADMGSGALSSSPEVGPDGLQTVASLVRAGADLVAFSGDKLLGGPQAGVLVGRASLIARLTQHPLNRALRIDKLTVAALEATLELYRDGVEDEAVPARALIRAPLEALAQRADSLSVLLTREGVSHRIVPTEGRVGGGSLPLAVLESRGVALECERGVDFMRLLRAGAPPVVGRLVDDQVVLDVRCLGDGELETVARCVAEAASKHRTRP
jgi:L-seryl-tRNA(Ser) seleniumtransferase